MNLIVFEVLLRYRKESVKLLGWVSRYAPSTTPGVYTWLIAWERVV